MTSASPKLYPALSQTLRTLQPEALSPERKALLQPLIHYLQEKVSAGSPIRLVFICTHNSRRSHLAQVWAATLAAHFGISNVSSFSAGTEATALNGNIVATLQTAGFEITALAGGENSVYAIKYGPNEPPVIGFSKTLVHPFNPQSAFAAVMTCTEADGGCPFVAGAEARISLPFEDPKAFDGTPQQEAQYGERSRQIATELYFVFSALKI